MSSDVTPAYVGGEQFQREKASIFGREWLVFCAVAQLGSPGAYIFQTVGGWPLVALRHPDGIMRGFRNQCRHQNMPILDQPAGCIELLRCRFHGWTYDLAGAFVTAPPMVAPDDPKSPEHHLHRVEVKETGGLVLLRLAASDVVPTSLPSPALPFAAARSVDLDCNWKVFVETQLSAGGWQRNWPHLFHRALDGAEVLRLVLPRSFTRTRAIDLVFGAAEMAASSAIGDAEKAAAVTLQRAFAAGTAPASENEAVLAFRDRIAASSAA
jgi:nitrite reductase/ring-hydroxylating ferredoxin subunit